MSSNVGKKIIEGKREKYFIYDRIIMDYMDKMMNISKEINELTEKKRKYITNEYIEKDIKLKRDIRKECRVLNFQIRELETKLDFLEEEYDYYNELMEDFLE